MFVTSFNFGEDRRHQTVTVRIRVETGRMVVAAVAAFLADK